MYIIENALLSKLKDVSALSLYMVKRFWEEYFYVVIPKNPSPEEFLFKCLT